MLSFRVGQEQAAATRTWSNRLGIDRSELLREALRLHLNRLASEGDAQIWADAPLSDAERSLEQVAEWGPNEDWADWADSTDATR